MDYYLSEMNGGRIVLDRIVHGEILATIYTLDPSVIRREVDGEMVEFPQYHESYTEALGWVDRSKFNHVRGEGYFARKR